VKETEGFARKIDEWSRGGFPFRSKPPYALCGGLRFGASSRSVGSIWENLGHQKGPPYAAG
jgi:hypothetical protein